MDKRLIVILIFIMVAGFFVILHLWPARREAVFYPMGGTPFRVIAYDRSSFEFEKDVSAAEKRVGELEDVFSSHRATSEVSRINREAHDRQFKMSADMTRVILSAKYWWEKTGGAFDVTVGPLIRLWKEAAEKGILPSEKEIEDAKKNVGMDKLKMSTNYSPPLTGGDEGEGGLPPPATKASARHQNVGGQAGRQGGGKFEIGLGGIAKGDIVDQVASMLQARGVKRGVVEAAGDILAFGTGTFRFGIQDPTAKAGTRLIGEVEIPAGAIVTSGNYERFIEIGGKKYSHIIDPKRGVPIDNGMVAATVIGGKCIDADAVATALMVMGREAAVEFLHRNRGFQGILIEKNGSSYAVRVSKDLYQSIHFEEPWSEFQLIMMP